MPSSIAWQSVAYGPLTAGTGLFAAVASTTTSAASSTDGTTWTLRALPSAVAWKSISYAGSVGFVAVASGTTTAAYSTDAVTWTATGLPSAATWSSIAYGNNEFSDVSNSTSAAYSSNGITWTTTTLPSSTTWSSISFGNGKFTAVASGTTSAASSTDGITWALRTLPTPASIVASAGTYSALPKLMNGEIDGPITGTTYTVQGSEKFITINSTAANTITLPNAAAYPNREILIKQIAAFTVVSATSNVQPLTALAAGTAILSGAGKFARIISNGQFWVVVEAN
jgi:hypothetical protein